MKQFFGMYRASASTDEVAGGVVSVGQALVKLGGADGRAAVDHAMNDGLTRDDVRERLRALVPPAETEKTDGAKPPEPGKKKKVK
jgi:hypothetical protein